MKFTNSSPYVRAAGFITYETQHVDVATPDPLDAATPDLPQDSQLTKHSTWMLPHLTRWMPPT